MVPFLFVLGLCAALITCGIYINLYLYNHGAIGNGSRHLRRLAVGSMYGEEDEDQSYVSIDEIGDVTSRYARNALVLLLFSFVAVVMLVVAFVNALMH